MKHQNLLAKSRDVSGEKSLPDHTRDVLLPPEFFSGT